MKKLLLIILVIWQGVGVSMENKSVLISGAGPSGLTLAYWLKAYGFSPVIVEKSPALREGGYKIDIRGSALKVVEKMGILPLIFEEKTQIEKTIIVDEKGSEVTTMSADLSGVRNAGDVEIMRDTLCQILFEQIPDVEIQFGNSIEEIKETATGAQVTFADGSTRAFALVVGADGLHSKVRQLAFGPESEFLQDLELYISVFSLSEFSGPKHTEYEFFGPQMFANIYSPKEGDEAKAAFAFAAKGERPHFKDTEKQKELLKTTFEKAGWLFPEIIEQAGDAPDFYFDAISQTHMPHWTKGRVALIGDAAYCPSPLSGQGTSVALVGAYVLAEKLAKAEGDHERAFEEYEKTMRPFIKENQELAKMSLSFMGGKGYKLTLFIHNLMGRFMPSFWSHLVKKISQKQTAEAANSLFIE